MNTAFKALMCLVVLAAAFYAGMKYQAFVYDDACLDLGGGRQPGGYPICVIERPTKP